MKIAIVYTSVSGNTKELAELLHQHFMSRSIDVDIFPIKQFPLAGLSNYNAIAIGTYTWGNGDIPREMKELYTYMETIDARNLTTAVFGTGDSFFPHFCGAVDWFRDMLYVQTDLAVTMKVELRPQLEDIAKCSKFVDCMLVKVRQGLKLAIK